MDWSGQENNLAKPGGALVWAVGEAPSRASLSVEFGGQLQYRQLQHLHPFTPLRSINTITPKCEISNEMPGKSFLLLGSAA